MNYGILIISSLNLILIIYVINKLHKKVEVNNTISREFALSRQELGQSIKDLRGELTINLDQIRHLVDQKIEKLTDKNDDKLERIRKTVEERLDILQKDNSNQLEKMRLTVDEKLQSTLEKRIGQSFKHVSERLEEVQKGLGSMQSLASNVGDFKRILVNVKTRGTWGEVQLESLLQQVFIKDHYERQVIISKSDQNTLDKVDFVIKLPDKSSSNGHILLPIDAKFPLEDYQRLVAAQEIADLAVIELATKSLISRIKMEAKSIKQKYIKPPKTTDFAILYVPIESLYAEILRQPGLFEMLQSEYRVTIAGPTTIAAILSSYQLGFRTLAIAEQTSNVWELLTGIRVEFSKFGLLLDKTKEKLIQATNNIDSVSSKSRTIEGKLNKVQLLAEKTVD